MMTVNEVSKVTGVSIRTLQYYDRIGLLHPADYTGAGYRLYDDTALERLQQILLFRELQFSLKEIRAIIDSPGFDRDKALEQQIQLLKLRKDRLDNLILFARGIKEAGVKHMNFSVFDTDKIDEYAARAKESWGKTSEYKEFEKKHKGRTAEEEKTLGMQMMSIFREMGALLDRQPSDPKVQDLVCKLQNFITEHYYKCSDEILLQLGQMYSGGGDMTENIDKAGGRGTAEFADQAIQIHCSR
jgi:DNA-binding transcriptional MerR regulator